MIVLIVYTWSIVWFFWKLPSWLFFLNIREILTALAYALATNCAESFLVLLAAVILSVALPKKWFYDVFVARGASLAMTGLGFMMFLADQFKSKVDYPALPLKSWYVALALAVILLLVFLAGRLAPLRKAIEFFADRATVFLYITIPLSIISAFVILILATI